jgi:hypothetical protein
MTATHLHTSDASIFTLCGELRVRMGSSAKASDAAGPGAYRSGPGGYCLKCVCVFDFFTSPPNATCRAEEDNG